MGMGTHGGIASRLGALAGLLAMSAGQSIGRIEYAPHSVPLEYQHANLSGRRRVDRGRFTRNRKSRGMNPKKRLRMERRRIERETQKLLDAPPVGQYLAYAVAPPERGVRKQAVLAGPVEFGPVAPVERAREYFAQWLPDGQPFEIKLRRPSW